MTISASRAPAYDRLAQYFTSPMLMLGRQTCKVKGYATAAEFFKSRYGVEEYFDLDLYSEGATFRLDLNDDLVDLSQSFGSVVNIGTLEHVWDVHAAWSNALRAVRVGSHFVSCAPISGFEGHGVHVTGAPWIREFVVSNGFLVLDEWEDNKAYGDFKTPKTRTIYWLAARKISHVEEFAKPMQIYKKGKVRWQ